jgi:hypothetical protein
MAELFLNNLLDANAPFGMAQPAIFVSKPLRAMQNHVVFRHVTKHALFVGPINRLGIIPLMM